MRVRTIELAISLLALLNLSAVGQTMVMPLPLPQDDTLKGSLINGEELKHDLQALLSTFFGIISPDFVKLFGEDDEELEEEGGEEKEEEGVDDEDLTDLMGDLDQEATEYPQFETDLEDVNTSRMAEYGKVLKDDEQISDDDHDILDAIETAAVPTIVWTILNELGYNHIINSGQCATQLYVYYESFSSCIDNPRKTENQCKIPLKRNIRFACEHGICTCS